MSEESESGGSSTVMIVGAIVGVVVIVGLGVACCACGLPFLGGFTSFLTLGAGGY